MRWLDSITDSTDMNLSELWEIVGDRGAWCAAIQAVAKRSVKIEGKRRRGQQRMRWLGSITQATDMNLSKLWETVKDRGAWCAAVARSWTQLSG